jgi:glutaredoxin
VLSFLKIFSLSIKMHLHNPAVYLENQDVNDDGSINMDGKVLLVLQSSGCGHCSNAEPAVQAAAALLKDQGIRLATIQMDASSGEGKAADKVKKGISSYRGVPSFNRYENGVFVIEHSGGRTTEELVEFMS